VSTDSGVLTWFGQDFFQDASGIESLIPVLTLTEQDRTIHPGSFTHDSGRVDGAIGCSISTGSIRISLVL
jgi:hypothetical protein